MYKKIIVRYGELTLKGKNKRDFIKRVYQTIQERLKGLDVTLDKRHDRLYIDIDNNEEKVMKALDTVFGLHSYSLVVETDSQLESIKEKALELARRITSKKTFKVESKRGDKNYPLTSLEISREVAGYVLSNTNNFIVDVRNPEVTLNVEVRRDGTYLYFEKRIGLGGLPVGVSGKGLLMLSGGIDSPVAGFKAMKRGLKVEGIHFESTPLTPIESAQKVIELAKKLALYSLGKAFVVYMVPFKKLHMEILDHVTDSYKITIMRRMMFRIAERLSANTGNQCIITGESLGQVASQTIESMHVINQVVSIPVLRPLIADDKNEIIDVSRKINTYEISIEPFEDCCTVYVPDKPVTKPKIHKCEFEERFEYEQLVEWCVMNTKKVIVRFNSDIDLPSQGFEVSEILGDTND